MMRMLKMSLAAAALTTAAAPAIAQSIYVNASTGAYYTVADSNDPYWRHRRNAYYHGGYESYAYVPVVQRSHYDAGPPMYYNAPAVRVGVDSYEYYSTPSVALTVGPRAYYRAPWGDGWGHRHYGYWQANPRPRIYYNAAYARADCRTVIIRGADGFRRSVRRCY